MRTRFTKEINGTQRHGTSSWFPLACEVFLGTPFFSVYVRQMPFAIVTGEAAYQMEERAKFHGLAREYLMREFGYEGIEAVVRQV